MREFFLQVVWIAAFAIANISVVGVKGADASDGDLFWYMLSKTNRQLVYDCEVDIWSEELSDDQVKVWLYIKTRSKNATLIAVESFDRRSIPQEILFPIEVHDRTRIEGLGWSRNLDLVLRLGHSGVPMSFEMTQFSVYAGAVDDKEVVCAGHPSARNRREKVE